MHTLPRVIFGRLEFRLPLAEPTAQLLAVALLETDLQRRRELFRAALADDPVLAVWTLAQALAQGDDHLDSLPQAAHWLAQRDVPFFLIPRDGHSDDAASLSEFAEPAGVSLAVAQLAAEFASSTGADVERARLLGLVHLGHAWLAESLLGDEPMRLYFAALPKWLGELTLELARPANEQTAEVRCVAQAMALVFSHEIDRWRAMGCDAQHWIGRYCILAEDWARSGPWSSQLPALVERLARLDLLDTQFQQELQAAKLESLKELAYGAGHEINNPLANISARAQTLLADESDPERRRMLAAINAQAFRGHEMIADMMLFARPPVLNIAEVDLCQIIRRLGEEFDQQARDQKTNLALNLPATPLTIAADATQFAVALRSLLLNALEALVEGGEVSITLTCAVGDSAARIVVADTGPGIPPEVRPKIFDPFFSGREAGRGVGLGLSKCWRIVTLHGGHIDMADRPAGGMEFTIALPTASE